MGAGIDQGAANRWFASESATSSFPPFRAGARFAQAKRAGVGVWVEGENTPVQQAPATIEQQPMSFASWLFNDCGCGRRLPPRFATRRSA